MRELSRKIVVLVSAIFLSISMISASFADGHGKKILFSIKGPGSGNPFWASVTKGAEEEAKKLGVKLILVAHLKKVMFKHKLTKWKTNLLKVLML